MNGSDLFGNEPDDDLVSPLPQWPFVGALPSWSPMRLVAIAAVAGCLLGIVSRAWMRWISTDPEFTWTGTIAIVASFTVFATAQAITATARTRIESPRRVAAIRTISVVLSLGLFGAAGSVMAPTVLFGSLALWRSDFARPYRFLFSGLAAPSVVFVSSSIVDDFGWSAATIGRLTTFVVMYLVVIVSTGPSAAPVADGWKPSRRAVLGAGFVVAVLLALALRLGGVQ